MIAQTNARSTSLLGRRVLQANAIFSTASGSALALGAGSLAGWFGLPPIALIVLGLTIVLFAVGLFFFARRGEVASVTLYSVAALDALWVVTSVFLILSGFAPLTVAGKWAVVILADIVAIFAGLEFYAARRIVQIS